MERYEKFRDGGWRSYEDCAKVISFFRKRKSGDQPVTGKVYVPTETRETLYDKSYCVNLTTRLIKQKLFTKALTRCKDGVKRRVTYRKDYLAMPEYNKYTWISLLETVRNAIRDGDEMVLLSNEEVKLLEEK